MKDTRIEMAAGTYLGDQVRAAIFEEDDEKIAAAYRGNERLLASLGALSDEEKNRIAVALERVRALTDLRAAFARHAPAEIVRVYLIHADTLEPSRSFTRDERRRVTLARRASLLDDFRQAVAENDVYKIQLAGKRAIEEGCQLSDVDHDAAQRARHGVAALEALRQALESDSDAAIADAYRGDLLDDCPRVTDAERKRIALAQNRIERWQPLRHALAREDDRSMVSLYDAALFAGFAPMSAEQRARCELAMHRMEAYGRLLAALHSHDPYKILQVYDEDLLAPCALLTPAQRRRVEDARYQVILVKAYKSGDVPRMADAYRALIAAHASVPEGVNIEAILAATRHVELVEEFRRLQGATDRHDPANPADSMRDYHSTRDYREDVVRLGERLLEMWPDLLTEAEHARIQRSKVQLGARTRLQTATASGDNQRVSIVLHHLLTLEAQDSDPHDASDRAVGPSAL